MEPFGPGGIGPWLRTLGSVVGGLIVLYIGLAALMYLVQERLIYFPSQAWDATPTDLGLAYEYIQFETADGVTLSGWFVLADQPRGTLLFFHGNGGNISHRLWSVELFHRLDLNTFIIDYRGYGQSAGTPSEQGTYLDAEAAWHYLTQARGIPPSELILFGESLGGAVAAWLAEKHPSGALILVSTFTSIPDMAAQTYPFLPVRWLARVRYNTLERLPNIHCPVLIVHSPADEIVPFKHGQQLFEAANQPKEFLGITGSHNEGLLLSAGQYQAGLAAFLTEYAFDAPKIGRQY